MNVQAWHLKGLLEKCDNPVSVECWIFDDPGNPLMLRYLIDKQKLQQVADIMQRPPSWKLRIEGHTDSVGGDGAANKALSARRAEAVNAAQSPRRADA